MTHLCETLERQLDNVDPELRREALEALITQVNAGNVALPAPSLFFNMHCHSFYSFNGYGYSPAGLAWRGRSRGLCALGLVDFDVLDGVDEFLSACQMLGVRAAAGMETRVFVRAFADAEINSPGEPGVAYHIGLGFVSSQPREAVLLDKLKLVAQQRTQRVLAKVNTLLEEIALDYERDVLPLTPKGNPTERHLCAAYDAQARTHFKEEASLASYWTNKLGMAQDAVRKALAEPPVFQGVLRGKTMKAGGVGYIQAKGDEFPSLAEVSRFILDNGAIPTFAFLDGASAGEQRMEELLDVMMASGVAAVNIIPDRNWNISDDALRAQKVAQLNDFIQRAQRRHLPIIVGTEMNAYGQRFVDDFDAPALKPHLETFREGMLVLYAHTLLQRQAEMGYLSDWANNNFTTVAEKNRFFVQLGRQASPETIRRLEVVSQQMEPGKILETLRHT